MFSPLLLAYFDRAVYAGEAGAPTARVAHENPACGDRLVLSVRVQEGKVEELRYLCRGCVAAMGCAAAFTELLQHQPVSDLAAFSAAHLLAAVGGLPPASSHALALVLEARDALVAVLAANRQPPGG